MRQLRLGLAYGVLSTRRRAGHLVLPVVTTATGAFLLVLVLGLAGTVRAQVAAVGNGDQVWRATVLIAVVVLLVGVVEVAVCTTRTIAVRTREIGVLGATGVPRAPVAAALLVEPTVAATAGGLVGGVVAVVTQVVLDAAGVSGASVAPATAALALLAAVGASAVAAVATSAIPAWRAASRPPVRSLSAST